MGAVSLTKFSSFRRKARRVRSTCRQHTCTPVSLVTQERSAWSCVVHSCALSFELESLHLGLLLLLRHGRLFHGGEALGRQGDGVVVHHCRLFVRPKYSMGGQKADVVSYLFYFSVIFYLSLSFVVIVKSFLDGYV